MEYTNVNDFSDVKVGDEVWSPIYKYGKILRKTDYGVRVSFECVTEDYDIAEINNKYKFVKDELYWQKPDWWQDNKYPTKQEKWRARKDQFYYSVESTGNIQLCCDVRGSYSGARFKIGNYFKTEQEARESKFYKVFHCKEEK